MLSGGKEKEKKLLKESVKEIRRKNDQMTKSQLIKYKGLEYPKVKDPICLFCEGYRSVLKRYEEYCSGVDDMTGEGTWERETHTYSPTNKAELKEYLRLNKLT